MSSTLHTHIIDFLEYMEVEKNCSKLTIRDYLNYLEVFESWFLETQKDKTISDLDLATVRRYRVFLANRIDAKNMTLKRGLPAKKNILNLNRQFLHAFYLGLTLPNGKKMALEANLPDDLRIVLTKLEK